MKFNWEISIGSILTTVTMVVAVVAFFMRLARIEMKVNIMFTWFQSAIIEGVKPSVADIMKFFGHKSARE